MTAIDSNNKSDNSNNSEPNSLEARLNSFFIDKILKVKESLGFTELYLNKNNLVEVATGLKESFGFSYLVSISGVDYLDHSFFAEGRANTYEAIQSGEIEDCRYEVVYQLMNIASYERVRIKVSLPENNPTVNSIVSLWLGANFMEREVYDMYGIKFENHPDLRRILMYEEFVGHPLRKDYPVLGKQPRVQLRYPEVHNTAKDMRRAELVQIGGAKLNSTNNNSQENISIKKVAEVKAEVNNV